MNDSQRGNTKHGAFRHDAPGEDESSTTEEP